jgi:hypothetical protein
MFSEFVNQLTGDELTEGYFQKDGAMWHIFNASKREILKLFRKICGRQDHQT